MGPRGSPSGAGRLLCCVWVCARRDGGPRWGSAVSRERTTFTDVPPRVSHLSLGLPLSSVSHMFFSPSFLSLGYSGLSCIGFSLHLSRPISFTLTHPGFHATSFSWVSSLIALIVPFSIITHTHLISIKLASTSP